jgi:hypothetical protein
VSDEKKGTKKPKKAKQKISDYRTRKKRQDEDAVDSIYNRNEPLQGEIQEQIIVKETDLRASLERVLKMPIRFINEHTQVVEEHLITDWISIALTAQAMKGNIQAIREIWDRIEGKPAQRVSVENQTKTLDTEDSEVLRNVRDKVTEMLEHVERKA